VKKNHNSSNNNNTNHRSKFFQLNRVFIRTFFSFILSLTNPNPEQQRVNSLLGPDAFKDVALNIDYGAVEAYNVAMQSSSGPTDEQLIASSNGGGQTRSSFSAGGQPRQSFSAGGQPRQSFSAGGQEQPTLSDGGQARQSFSAGGQEQPTLSAGGQPRQSFSAGGQARRSLSAGGQGRQSSSPAGQRFDVARAIFYQADANHDGSISREEFRNWATVPGALPRASRQTAASHGSNADVNLNNAQIYEGASPEAANILHQSGLAQKYTNYG